MELTRSNPHGPQDTVRTATLADLKFVLHLQRTWSRNLGFLPSVAIERYLARGGVTLVRTNQEPAGYLLHTINRDKLVRILQVAIDPELLRTTLGTLAMHHTLRQARAHGAALVRLTSRSDLIANQFWPNFGFKRTAILRPDTRKKLPHYEWSLQLPAPPGATL